MLGDFLRSDEGGLARLARDLTAEARADRLEPVCCRGAEIDRVIDILLRQSKNNPALVGPAGVGKTAIAEGLALRVTAGDVPLALRSARILALDHVALLAGTMFRGQYEERLRAIVAEASADPDIILFIDELHNLIGQGTAIGVAMDAANMLKPALVRGDFRVIGATTNEEYDRWVRGDPALERRFQKITVRELTTEETMEVLRARRERLERHHNVAISDDALIAAVRLSDLFITDRARPDRAIDALDEACAHAQARAAYSAGVESLIAERRGLAARLAKEAREAEERGERRPRRAERAARPASGDARPADAHPPEAEDAALEDDPLERWARDGLAALERFGADLEAAFTGRQPGSPHGQQSEATPERAAQAEPLQPAAGAHPPTGASPAVARQAPLDARARLAIVELELRRRLMDEGHVVRGYEVARVVSAATGQRVEWQA